MFVTIANPSKETYKLTMSLKQVPLENLTATLLTSLGAIGATLVYTGLI